MLAEVQKLVPFVETPSFSFIMAASETDSVKNEDPRPKYDLTNNTRFKSVYDAVLKSTWGSTIPPSLCYVIAEFGWIYIDSSLLTREEQDYIFEMITSQRQTEKFAQSEWNLLCRHSRDRKWIGYARGTNKYEEPSDLFHRLCDGKRHTICLMDVDETGYICGGYASAAWGAGGSPVKDDDTFLFVIRPKGKRAVFHRKRDDSGKLIERNGILNSRAGGFNFGFNTFSWGISSKYYQSEEGMRAIHTSVDDYYTHQSKRELVGKVFQLGWSGHWTDFEVFQLVNE